MQNANLFGELSPSTIGGGGGTLNLQEKTVNPSKLTVEVTPDEGFDGMSKVTVNYIKLQQKQVTPTNVTQVITPDSGFDGLSLVGVAAASGLDLKGLFDRVTTLQSYDTSSENPYSSDCIFECEFPILTRIDCAKYIYALMGLHKLKAVHFKQFVELVNYQGYSPFPDFDHAVTVYVPSNLLATYQADANWTDLLTYNPNLSLVGE